MNRVAFRLPDDGVWTGGVNYLETVCRALLAHSDLGYEPIVFCNPEGDPQLLARFDAFVGISEHGKLQALSFQKRSLRQRGRPMKDDHA